MIERLQPAGAPAPSVPLSPGTSAGGFVFVSGQTATTEDGRVYVGDVAREVESALDNVERILQSAGASWRQVVRVGAYLSNAILFAQFNEIYARRVGSAPPARTTVVVAFGHPDVRVEIDAIAYVG
jgi:2-iminobutanoate/2-iminopropanoate deaminase